MSQVIVVTGGGGGIGAAIAEELGRQGAFVVTIDPLVTLDGAASEAEPGETTADRIVAAGGQARASNVSVTDLDAVCAVFDDLVDEFGGVDGVVNVAGISRPTSFAKGSEADWLSVLDVHLNGYRNVLEAALPVMSEARHGRIVGVTSGSGWRAADAGAYACAKRAVASLTWQLGWQAPPGVSINAMSPIAVTRMVTAALAKVPAATASKNTGGLSLGSMPEPEELGPFAAYLLSDAVEWCSGEVFFAGGPEIAVVEAPRLLEVVRTDGVGSVSGALATAGAALLKAEETQVSGGGSNPRFPGVFDATADALDGFVATCLIVTHRPEIATALTAMLAARGVKSKVVPGAHTFEEADALLRAAVDELGDVHAVVVANAGPDASFAGKEWERTLEEHAGIVEEIHHDASWVRAVSTLSAATNTRVRLVTITDATTSGGRSRAQAAAQLARPSRKASEDRVAAFSVSLEVGAAKGATSVAELTAYLLASSDALGLAGAELVVGDGWLGVRSHPRASSSLVYGGGAIPEWFDGALRGMVR